MAIFQKFSFCHFSPGEEVFLPYRQKLGNYRGFYCDVEKPANPDCELRGGAGLDW